MYNRSVSVCHKNHELHGNYDDHDFNDVFTCLLGVKGAGQRQTPVKAGMKLKFIFSVNFGF